MFSLKKLAATLVVGVSLLAVGCGGGDTAKEQVLKVGATPNPHAEILNLVKDDLAKDGYKLEVVEFNDYVQPNLATNDGELAANFFQHLPYLEDFTKEHPEVKLVSAAGIHIEPMGLYSNNFKSVAEVTDGAKVSIPNDPTNGGRALLLLQKAGLIKLADGVGITATVQDVIDNPKNIQFVELEAAQIPRTLADVDMAVINSNFALQVPLNPVKDSIFIEDKDSPYVNIIAVKAGSENNPEIKALVKAIETEKVKEFINSKYDGAVVPVF